MSSCLPAPGNPWDGRTRPAGATRRLAWVGTLLLHGAIAGVALTRTTVRDVPPPSPTTVNVQLIGMIADRQSEARSAARQDTPKPVRVASRPTPQRRAPQSGPPPQQVDPDTVDERTRTVQAAPASAAEPAAPPAPPADARPAEEAQPARALRQQEDEAAAIRRYVAALGRALQRQVVYPQAARGSGATGAPLVAFTLLPDGAIQPGSLRLQRSCGHALLDEEALRTVRDGAPFAPPPKRLAVVVALAFVREH